MSKIGILGTGMVGQVLASGFLKYGHQVTIATRNPDKVADWLESRRPKKLRVLVSPTTRTRQTASAFTQDFEVVPALAPGNDIAGILGACGWPDGGGSVLIVGHQPELGRLASLLLSGHEADWTIKKGALWWFSNRVRDDETQTVLRAVMPADLV